MKKIIKLILATFFLLFYLSCTQFSVKQWENLTDRKFFFTKFTLIKNGADKSKAFSFMKNFPVDYLSQILENKYKISINQNNFKDFILSETKNKIIAQGILSKNKFIWQDGLAHTNTIELTYTITYDYELNKNLIEYRLILKSNNKIDKLLTEYIESPADLIADVKKKLSGINISSANIKPEKKVEQKIKDKTNTKITEKKIKGMIDKYYNSLNKSLKKSFKKRIINYIMDK